MLLCREDAVVNKPSTVLPIDKILFTEYLHPLPYYCSRMEKSSLFDGFIDK